MTRNCMLATALFFVALPTGIVAQTPQSDLQTAPTPRPVRQRPTFAQQTRFNLLKVGATVDDSKSSAEMIVSNYPDLKGGKTTLVITNDRRKSLVGFYVYNFGSLKNVTNREEIYKYLLSTNDAITIGSFFVDGEDDIGYKYLVSNAQTLNQAAFESAYLTMAAVARERRPEIRRLLGLPTGKEEKGPDVKKAADEKPPPKS
jgi:hypothetical protein